MKGAQGDVGPQGPVGDPGLYFCNYKNLTPLLIIDQRCEFCQAYPVSGEGGGTQGGDFKYSVDKFALKNQI